MANTTKPKTGRQHNDAAAGSEISNHRWVYQRHNKRGGEEQNHEDDQLRNKNRSDDVAQRGRENRGSEKVEYRLGQQNGWVAVIPSVKAPKMPVPRRRTGSARR